MFAHHNVYTCFYCIKLIKNKTTICFSRAQKPGVEPLYVAWSDHGRLCSRRRDNPYLEMFCGG